MVTSWMDDERRGHARVVNLSPPSDEKTTLLSEVIIPTLSRSEFTFVDIVNKPDYPVSFDDVGWAVLILDGNEPVQEWLPQLQERNDSVHVLIIVGPQCTASTRSHVRATAQWEICPDIILLDAKDGWDFARRGFVRAIDTAILNRQRRLEDTTMLVPVPTAA